MLAFLKKNEFFCGVHGFSTEDPQKIQALAPIRQSTRLCIYVCVVCVHIYIYVCVDKLIGRSCIA